MSILVTGATGYLGQRLAMHLAQRAHDVHLLVRNASATKMLTHPRIRIHTGDITQIASVRGAMTGCTHVFHVAGLARLSHKDPSLFYRVNVDGTRNVLQAALEAGVKKMVYTSSTGVIGPSLGIPMSESDPRIFGYTNDYEISKHMAEQLVEEYAMLGLHGVIVSPSRVYGPGIETYSNGVNRFIRNTLNHPVTFIPDCGRVKSNYAFIDDVVHGHILAMEKGIQGEKYILGGENVPFATLVDLIRQHTPQRKPLVRLPKSVIRAAAGCIAATAWLGRRSPALTPKVIDRLFQEFIFSSDKAITQLGYEITPFAEGVKQTVHFLQNGKH